MGFYLRKDIEKLVPLSDVTLWRMEKKGLFPKRRKISEFRVGWLKSEIDQWIISREAANN